MLRILYVTADNSLDTRSENNGFYLGEALEATGNRVSRHSSRDFTLTEKMLFGPVKLGFRALRKEFRSSLEPMVVERRAKLLEQHIRETKPDLVFANAPIVVAGIDTSIPYVIYTDSPVSQLIAMGHYCDAWSKRSVHLFSSMDRRTLERACKVVYHTRWAAEMAIRDYGLDRSKVEVVLPGANFPYVPITSVEVHKERRDQCELLFWGRNWQRKGGPLAIEIVERLNRRGIRSRLTICGPRELPRGVRESESIRFLGHQGKGTPAQLSRIQQLFSESDYLLLPTRAEASTSAIREASAFGLPSIVTSVGGLTELVADGSGFALPKESTPEDYVNAIQANFLSQSQRLDMRVQARLNYEKRLNWSRSSQGLGEIFGSIVRGG